MESGPPFFFSSSLHVALGYAALVQEGMGLGKGAEEGSGDWRNR